MSRRASVRWRTSGGTMPKLNRVAVSLNVMTLQHIFTGLPVRARRVGDTVQLFQQYEQLAEIKPGPSGLIITNFRDGTSWGIPYVR